MGAPTPCLGYASRTAAIQALRADGLSTAQIARRIGIDTSAVTALEASARRHRRATRDNAVRATAQAAPIISLATLLGDDTDLRAIARRHAARRSTTVERLARSILAKVLEEDIVDAVLDDADEIRRAS